MTEEVNLILEVAKDQMSKSIEHLESELSKVRAGKASPSMVDGIKVDYYGVNTPIEQTANVNVQDAKTLVIKPWEKTMLKPIEKALLKANLGVTPQNDGELIRLVMPPVTEERRKDLVKKVKSLAEQARVSIRNSRRDAMQHMKDLQKEGLPEDMEKRGEQEVQDMTNKYTEQVEKHVEAKEKEIMHV